MNVLMVTNVIAPDKLGGLERYVRELSAALVRAGHNVTVISKRTADSQPTREIASDGVEIIRISPPNKRNPLFALAYPVLIALAVRKAIKEARARGPIVLHGHFPVPMIGPSFGRVPYIYTCHAPVYKEILDERQGSYSLPGPVQKLAVWGLKTVERHVLKRAKNIITLSSFIRNEVAVLDRAAGGRVQLLAGGLDTEKFAPSETSRSRAEAGPVLFAARRLVKRTGAEELVAAMPEILRSLPGAQLMLAGDGTRREHVAKAIVENGLSEQVKMLGRIPEDDLIAWYQNCDIAITPTQALEGFGLSTVEALACGTPALVTPVGANAEVVGTLSPLLVAGGKAPGDIAKAVIALWNDGDAYERIQATARAHVEPEMSWSNVAEKHVELYSALAALPGVTKR
jgi:glycosyltransferase involved in cell wall biosynthesis